MKDIIRKLKEAIDNLVNPRSRPAPVPIPVPVPVRNPQVRRR